MTEEDSLELIDSRRSTDVDDNKNAKTDRVSSSVPDQEAKVGRSIEAAEAHKKLGAVSNADPAEKRVPIRVYRQRWVVLAVIALLNNLNTMSWIAFAPVANHVDVFYTKAQAANFFSLVYMVFTIPVGFFAMWAARRFGLRSAVLIAAWSNGIGGLIRFISSFVPKSMAFPVGIFGQAIAGTAYPFIMFLPTKVANAWFAENERALATTIGVMSNPLGVLAASLISPQIVSSSSDVPIINAITFVPSIFVTLVATVIVRRSQPKLPPSLSAAQTQMDFLPGLKKCISSRAYLLLLIVMGGGIGMFNCLYTIMQQLLCPSGYSNSFSGICAALMIVGGVFGATASGIFVDRTKLYEETMKVSLALAVVIGLLFLQLTLHAGLAVPIAVCCFIFGVLGLATYPVGLEMSTECTFPVPETISTGLIVISGQIQSSVYLGLMKYFAKPLQPDYMDIQVCTTGEKSFASLPKDNTNCVIIFSGIATSLVLILIILFRPKYKRLMAEQNGTAKAKALLANEEKTGVINDKRVKVYLSKECSAAQPLTHGIVNSTG